MVKNRRLGTVKIVKSAGSQSGTLTPNSRGCGNASVGERADGVGRAGGAILGVLVVVEEDAVPLLFPPLGTGDVGPAVFDGARECHGGAAHFGESPLRLDADVDVHTAGTAGFRPAVKAHVGKEGFDFKRNRADVLPGNAGRGIEVNAEFVRVVKIARPDGVGMEFDAAEVHYPGQAGSIIDNNLFRGTT